MSIFKKGDTILIMDGGVVTDIEEHSDFSVTVRFTPEHIATFTAGGREFADELQVLSFEKYDFINGDFSLVKKLLNH